MVIAFAGQKGGAGKSTAAINVAAEALRRGLDVLLIDADPQGTARSWHAAAAEAGHPAPAVLCLSEDLHRRVPSLAKEHELVVIDCPPRHAEIQRAALLVADVFVIPAAGTPADAWALVGTAKLIDEARKVRPKLDARVLISRLKASTSVGRMARDVLAGAGLPLLRAELRDRVAFQEAMAAGLGVTVYAPRSEAADEVRAVVDELTGKEAKRRGK